MKKVLLLSAMISLLAACGSDPENKPAVEDENSLPPGIMQPVESTGAVEGGGLEPEIQKQSMPAGM